MSPYSHFERRDPDGMLVVGEFEFDDDVYRDHLPVRITPSIRDFLWDYTERNAPRDLLYAFDTSYDAGVFHVDDIAYAACHAYLELGPDAQYKLHDEKLIDLLKQATKLERSVEWSKMIADGLMAHLNSYKGPPPAEKSPFIEAISTVRSDTEDRLHATRCDLNDEQEWECIPDDMVDV